MKRLLYYIITAAVTLTGCTTWDDPVTENYGAGPSIEVSVKAAAPTDSAFVISIVPGEGTTYYAYVLDANDEAEELDAATLLKGGYGNDVFNTSKDKTLTVPVNGMAPNTTYQVYAVASNDKGIVGKVAVASIKTTDSGKPQIVGAQVDAASKTAAVAFNQLIQAGQGKVTAKYYKEFDFSNPVDIQNVKVDVSKNVAQFTAPEAPAGAYVIFSWEEGAFVDAVGNKCASFTSTINLEGSTIDEIFGDALWLQVPNETWAIADSCFTAPKAGGTFPKWSEFEGVIEFIEKVYVVEEEVKDGDFIVTYTNNSRTVNYKLPKANITFGTADDFSTQKVTFKLPAATQAGDKVTVSIAEGVFKDVLGNSNAAYSSDKVFWTSYSITKADVLGSYTFYWVGSKTYNLGKFTIEEDTGEDAEEGDVVIKDFYVEGGEIYGYYILEDCKLCIYAYQAMGLLHDDEDGDYGNYLMSVSGKDVIEFDFTPDVVISSDLKVMATDPEYAEGWWWEIPEGGTSVLVKNEASSTARRAAAKGGIKAKSRKNLPKSFELFHK